MEPTLIQGGKHEDERGTIQFINDFDLKDIRRFYTIHHHNTQVIRAWQGHKIESKHFYVLQGKFIVAWVEIDDFENPSDDLTAEYEILNANQSSVLFIPPGYANGIKAQQPDSKIAVFSNKTLKESEKERIRYPSEKWLNWHKLP
jgi:dTDP-4-dehydrorhamnose 3,5-epimerase